MMCETCGRRGSRHRQRTGTVGPLLEGTPVPDEIGGDPRSGGVARPVREEPQQVNGRKGEPSEPRSLWLYAIGRAKRGSDAHRDAMGTWLESLGSWTLFVTRTLGGQSVAEGEPSVGTARQCLRDLLLRTEAARFVAVFELQKRAVYHLHALLETSKAFRLYQEQERDYLMWGIARWKVYQEGGGAAGYVGKYLAKDMVEMYIGLDGPYTRARLAGKTIGGTRV